MTEQGECTCGNGEGHSFQNRGYSCEDGGRRVEMLKILGLPGVSEDVKVEQVGARSAWIRLEETNIILCFGHVTKKTQVAYLPSSLIELLKNGHLSITLPNGETNEWNIREDGRHGLCMFFAGTRIHVEEDLSCSMDLAGDIFFKFFPEKGVP